jgi:uroporphyrinogen decarboxylase
MITKIQRVKAAFMHKESDRIPMGEWGLGLAEENIKDILKEEYDENLATCFRGSWTLQFNKNNLAVRNILNHDLVNIQPAPPEPIELNYEYKGLRVLKDAVGGHIVIPEKGAMHVVRPVFNSLDDVKSYKFPSIDSYDFAPLTDWIKKSDYYVFGMLEGVFFLSYWEFFDFEYFFTSCIFDKNRIRYWFKKAMEFYLELGNRQVDLGVHGMAIHDDHAFNSGPFLSPKIFRELFMDIQKHQVDIYRGKGIEVGMHCDGNLEEVLEYAVEMDYQAIQGLQPSAGNNIKKVKEKYNDKLVLIGNVDNDLLLRGTEKEVIDETKRVISSAARGGGFILSSSCGLDAGAKTENVLAMYNTGNEFGKYPIVDYI